MTGISAPPAQTADLSASARPASVSLGDAEVVQLPARVSANVGASAGRGITLTGTVQSQTPDGTVTLRTAAGDVQLRTGTPLPTDRPVTVQVTPSGDGGALRAQITTTATATTTPAANPAPSAASPVLTPSLPGAAAEAQLLRTLAAALPDLPLAAGTVLRAIRLPDGITVQQLFAAAGTPASTGAGGAAAAIPLPAGASPAPAAAPVAGNAAQPAQATPAAGAPPAGAGQPAGALPAAIPPSATPQPGTPAAIVPAGAGALPDAAPPAAIPSPAPAAVASPAIPAQPAVPAGNTAQPTPAGAASPATGGTPPAQSAPPPAAAPAAPPPAASPAAALGPAASPAAAASLAAMAGTGALPAAELLARSPIVTRIARPGAPAGPTGANPAAGGTAGKASAPAPSPSAPPSPAAGPAASTTTGASAQPASTASAGTANPAIQAARSAAAAPLSAISAMQEAEAEPVAAISRPAGGAASSPGPVPPGGNLSVRILAAPGPAGMPLATLSRPDATGAGQRATVIDRTSQGAPVIGIGTARYLLETTQGLPIDSELTVALLPDDLQALPALPADPDAATLAGGMPALDDGLELLAALNPALGEMLRRTLVPRPDTQLAPSLAILLTALRRGGDAAGWIGGAAAGLLRASPQGGATLKRMGEELSSLRHSAFDGAGNEWRGYTVPLEAGALLQPVQFYLRGAGSDKESPEDAAVRQNAGVRFLIDLELSRLGPLQLEGLSRPAEQRLDMVLRSGTGWQREMEDEIRGLYVSALQASGLGGTVIFQNGFDGWVRLTRERSAAHVGTVNI